MKGTADPEAETNDSNATGLPWPRTWTAAYLFVLASFALWLSLLLLLMEYCR